MAFYFFWHLGLIELNLCFAVAKFYVKLYILCYDANIFTFVLLGFEEQIVCLAT